MVYSTPTLDDLTALNREIAALVRAGIPLELGLRGLSGSVGSRLGRLSERLSDRMACGLTLPDALAEEGPSISPIYTSVIQAGLASGKLPEALESLATSGHVLQEIRRRVFLAVLYPMICLVLAYLLFCGFVTVGLSAILNAADMFRLPKTWSIELLRNLHHHQAYLTMVFPLVLLGLFLLTLLLRVTVARAPWQFLSSFGWVPGVARVQRSLMWAQFTELLALQIEQSSSLASSIVLAADSTDKTWLKREAREIRDVLGRGAGFEDALKHAKSLPPLTKWMLATGEKQGTLAITLRQLAEMYRRQALQRATALKTWLPVMVTVFVTGVIGLSYGLAFFIPLKEFLTSLMKE